jgi:hypothetical protein
MRYRIIEKTKAEVFFEYFVEADSSAEALAIFKENPPIASVEYIGDVFKILNVAAVTA